MSNEERYTLSLVVMRLKSFINGDGTMYAGPRVPEGCAIFLNSWVLPQLQAVTAKPGERSGQQRQLLRCTTSEMGRIQARTPKIINHADDDRELIADGDSRYYRPSGAVDK